MRILPALELIREKTAFYLGDQQPSGRYLAVQLADCALASGVHRVELRVLPEGWMAVSTDADWISPNLQDRTDTPWQVPLGVLYLCRADAPIRSVSRSSSPHCQAVWVSSQMAAGWRSKGRVRRHRSAMPSRVMDLRWCSSLIMTPESEGSEHLPSPRKRRRQMCAATGAAARQ